MLRLDEHWIWDSWIADDGDSWHLFFLQAPRALGDPRRRHTAASIGHASSTDLTHWRYHGVALAPAPYGWDDLALWTGSTVRGDDGRWRLFYTGLSTADDGRLAQRIGVAVSDDLVRWNRTGDRPVVEVDARWYETFAHDRSASETWRDPLVFRDPGGDGWHMLVCARQRDARRFDDGVVAHARSADLRRWEVGPPVSAPPAGFGQLEVPQVHNVDGTWTLVFTCHPDEQSARRRAESGYFCTWTVTGESMTGPWDITRARPFTREPHLFAAPLVRRREGDWVFLGFRNQEPQGIHSFEIIDPVPAFPAPVADTIAYRMR